MKKFNQSVLATAMLLAAGGVNAAAFQLSEVSTSGLGRAYAGEAAIADNASVVATNPALMSLFKTNQFSVGGVYVDSKINMNGNTDITALGRNVGARLPSASTIFIKKSSSRFSCTKYVFCGTC